MNRKLLLVIVLVLAGCVFFITLHKTVDREMEKPGTSFVEWVEHYESVEDMINHSDLIIKGNLVGNDPEDRSGMIVSRESVKVKKCYKGKVAKGEILSLYQTGGTLGDVHTEPFPEAPLLEKRKDYILFLRATEDGYLVMGGYQGLGKVIGAKLDLNFIGDPVTDRLQDMKVQEVEGLIEKYKY